MYNLIRSASIRLYIHAHGDPNEQLRQEDIGQTLSFRPLTCGISWTHFLAQRIRCL